jgi:hypothetical protein
MAEYSGYAIYILKYFDVLVISSNYFDAVFDVLHQLTFFMYLIITVETLCYYQVTYQINFTSSNMDLLVLMLTYTATSHLTLKLQFQDAFCLRAQQS